MIRSLVVVALCGSGCGRVNFEATSSPSDRDGGGDGDAVAMDTSSVSVSHVIVASWTPIDLTTTGVIDWIQWGWGGIGVTNRKIGGTAISGWSQIGGGTLVLSSVQPVFTWTDGTPTAIASPADQFIYVDSATTEDGLRIVVNAGTVPRTLVVYTGTFCTKLRLAATLQLSGTGTRTGTDSAWDNPVPAGEYGYYVVQFQAGASGRTLTIDLVIDQNYCPTGDLGEVWLGGAALY